MGTTENEALGAHDGEPGDFRADLEKYRRICLAEKPATRLAMIRLFLTQFGLQCVAVYRFHRWVRRLRHSHRIAFGLLRPIAALLNQAVAFVHKVHLGADIGPGLYIGHVGHIYVGARRIGRNFSLTHNVTIGRGPGRDAQGLPTIGNDVWVGTASVISGDIEIGDGVTLSSGTVLSRSVPAGALVAGNPGRVAQLRYDNTALLGLPPVDPKDVASSPTPTRAKPIASA